MDNPIPWARVKTGRYGNKYDSQKLKKRVVGDMLKYQFRGKSSLFGCLYMIITFYHEIPSSWSRLKKEKVAGKRKSSRPDKSNLTKFYEDVMQDVGIYKDDAQIVASFEEKLYDDGQGARVEITLKEVE